MFKKLNKMKIGARLKKIFQTDYSHFGILSALVVVDYALYDKQLWNDTG